MAILSFEIQADYDKVIKLREEIVRLENVMKNFDASTTQDTIRKTEQQLASNREALDKLTSSAAKAATAMNGTFSKGMSNAQSQMSQTSKLAKEQAAAIDALYGKLASTAAKLGVSLSALSLGNRIMKTRGDFQQLEMAFQTMLGSAEKGQALMNQLVRTAAVTPFDLKGVANGAKQLLAYGIAADEVNDTVVKLGDVAAGLSIPLNDLIYVYGTTITQGRMFTMDLRQLQGRGVPIAEALAKQLGIAKNEVSNAVSKGKVDAETFKKAMLSLSDAGSQFGGLMDAQSKTITGQIANIEDAIDMMFNDMGKQSEGVINTGLSAVSYLIENYEKVGKILLVAAVAFGTYKASLIATQAIEKIKNNSAISGLEAEITKVNEEIAARERLNATIANQPTQGKTTVGATSTPSNTGNEQIDGLQAQLAERKAILSQIRQEEAVEKQAKLNIAATEHTAAQSQLAIAQEKQKMAKSSLALAEQEYSVAQKEKVEAEARVILANQEVDARKKALLNAQQGGNDAEIKDAGKSLNNATAERDAAYAAQTAAYARYNSASQNLSTARDASNIAITQAETAALNEQTAAQNLHNASVEQANALNALNAGETNEAAIAARNEVIEIEAKTAALEAEIERKRELLALPAEGETVVSPEVAQAQSKLDEQVQLNEALDAEFQKRVDIANQDLTFAQENYKSKSDALDVAEQEYLSSQENLSLAIKNKEAIDEKVKSSKEYLESMKEINEGDSETIASAEDDLYTAITEQQAAAKEVETAAEAANTAEKKLNTAAEEVNTAQTKVNTAQTNLNTATKRQQAAAEIQNTVTTKTNTNATAGNTAAVKSNTIASRLNALGQRALAGAHTLLTGAVTACKTAFNSLKVAMVSNPIGAIVTALTTAISLFMAFGDETEEVSENVEKFGEASAKSVAKVNTLYEVLKHSDSQSKVYKDAMSELKTTCEEYGIVINKEGNLIDQLNAKRETLISLIEKEGAARIYANSVAAAEGDYTKTIDNVQKEISEKLKDTLKDSGMADTYSSIITQNLSGNIEELQAAYKNMQEKIKGQATQYNPTGYSTQEVRQATKEYNDLLDKMSLGAREAAKANGENEEALKALSSTARSNARTIIEGKNAYDKKVETLNRAKDETEKAITATSGLTSEEQRLASQSQISHLKVSDLQSKVADILKECSNKHLFEIEISLNTTKVPKWMQQQLGLDGTRKTTQKDVVEAKGRAAIWASAVEEANRKGAKEVKVAGKTMKTEDAGKRAAEYTVAASQAQENVDKQAAEAKEAEKEAKKKAEKAAKEAAKEAQNRKKAQENLNKEMLSLRQKNQDEEINLMEDGTEKKKQQIENDYKKQLDTVKTEAEKLAKLNKESGKAGSESVKIDDETVSGLTSEQVEEVNKSLNNAKKEQEKATNEIYKEELASMREYLKNYGTYQQQKLAIAEEYAEKIKKAQESGDKAAELTATKERDKALQDIEVSAIKQQIDWGSVFGDFGTLFKDQLQPTIEKLREIAGKDEFKTATLEEQKTLYELIQKLEQSNATWDSDIFVKVSEDLTAYQKAMADYIEAQERERIATENLATAKNNLKEAEAKSANSETDPSVKEAKNAVANAQSAYDKATEDVTAFSTKVQETTTDLQSSSDRATAMFSELESGLSGFASGSLSGIGEGLMKLDKLFNKGGITEDAGNLLMKGVTSLLGKDSKASKAITDALGSTGMAGEIISAALGIMDLLKDGIGTLVANLIDTVLGAVNGIIGNLISGNMFVQIGSSIVKNVGSLLNTVTFGGFSSWTSGNGKEVANKLAILNEKNEVLTSAIEHLTDAIENSDKPSDSIKAYMEAVEAQETKNRNLLEAAQTQGGYHSAHHSWNYYWNGFSADAIAQIEEKLGRDFNGDIWSLSPEDMQSILDIYDVRNEISSAGKGGYGSRVLTKLEEYAEEAGQLEELTDTLNETINGISFDSFKDNFLDALTDMEQGVEDLGEDINQILWEAFIKNGISEAFSDDMQSIYDDMTEMNKARSKGTLSDEAYKQQLAALRESATTLAQNMIDWRDTAAELFEYDKYLPSDDEEDSDSQDSSYGSTSSITQDQASEISGRLTAVQYAGQERNEQLTLANAKLDMVVAKQSMCNELVDGIQDILAKSLLHLENIDINTEAMVNPIKLVSEKIESWDKIIKNL